MVSGPHCFNAEPDPDLDPVPDPGFDDKKIEKILQLEKINFFYQKIQFTYP
jgi:hypothetical protein